MSVNLPQQWLDKAKEDLIVARLVLDEDHNAIPGTAPSGVPSNTEAEEAITSAEEILQFVLSQV